MEEIGPAPPIAASQIMISNSSSPAAVEEVNKSYATSETTSVPAYFHAQDEVMEVIADSCFAAAVTTTFGYDFTELAAPDQDHVDDHASLEPLRLETLKQPLPDVAESWPQRLLYTVYEPVTMLS